MGEHHSIPNYIVIGGKILPTGHNVNLSNSAKDTMMHRIC
jgi:hypothetical protein